jgi:hypothetical protein
MKYTNKLSKWFIAGSLYGACLFLNTGCSGFLPDRSYIEEMNRESDPFLQAGKDFPIMSGDTGEAYRSREEVQKRTPSSERNRQSIKQQESIRQELEQKEADIPSENLGQYTKDKKYLPTDSDKLYYLSLSASERGSYINTKRQDMQEDQGKEQDFIQKRSIHHEDLYIGMAKTQVLQVWGKPSRVEVAGNPKNQNERWSFVEDGNVKQIYFESGKVQGWALDL